MMIVSVCRSDREHISESARSIFPQRFFRYVTCVCGSFFLWWRCDMLHTSGFTDDVIFTHNEPYAGVPV